MRYVRDGDPTTSCVVWVTGCTDLLLAQAAAFLGKERDWPRDVMLAGMREHYPAIAWEDVVQIVEHLTPEASRRRADFPE